MTWEATACVPPIAITDPGLIERQTLPDEDFPDHFYGLVGHFPPREFSHEQFERGLRYPWFRPERSYHLTSGGEVRELGGRPDLDGRAPLLAIGGNAAPKYLTMKLAHHEDPADREVVVLAGELHGFDVAAAAAVTVYGAMAATLVASPGTAVRAAALMVTSAQLTTLTWGEMPYRVGRLSGASFTVEEGVPGTEVDSPLVFVSRWGAFAPDGAPAALAAIPARERRHRAWSQRELLDRAAQIVLAPDADAETLMRHVCRTGGAVAREILPALRPHAQPFDLPGWAPMSADGTFP